MILNNKSFHQKIRNNKDQLLFYGNMCNERIIKIPNDLLKYQRASQKDRVKY